MTERRKDVKKGGVKIGDVLDHSLDFLQSKFPEWTMLAAIQIVYTATAALKKYIQEDKTGQARTKPFLQLDYDASDFPGTDEAEMETFRKEIISEKEAMQTAKDIFGHWPEIAEKAVLSTLTSEVIIRQKEGAVEGQPDAWSVLIPPDLEKKLAALPEAEREKEVEKLFDGYVFDGMKFSAADTASGREVEGEFFVRISPLLYIPDQDRAFWPIRAGVEFTKGDFSVLSDTEIDEAFDIILKSIDMLAEQKAAGEEKETAPVREPDRVVAVSRKEYFKAPGRLFDTPRHIAAEKKKALLPDIDTWYKINSPLNRRVAMAAAALTKYSGREAAFGMQEVTLKELEGLVYIGAPAHGQHLFDILRSFEMLLVAPLPLVRVEWEPIRDGKKKTRWKKRYVILRSALFQSYGPVFEDRKTRKRTFIDDPAYSKDKVKAKPSRRLPVEIDDKSPWVNVFNAFPLDRYRVAGLQFRWNTDVAQDFIMPGHALDEKGNVRLALDYKPHKEGKRFVMLYGKWFEVAKRLTEQKRETALRLLDFLVSEKTMIKRNGRTIDIEIAADKIIKELGRWPEYQSSKGRKDRVLETIAEAVITLQKEKVLLPLSTPWPIEYPEGDRRLDRRVNAFYRWKLAAEWSTVAMVPETEITAIEAEAVAEREREESAAAPVPVKVEDVQPKERFLPGFILPPVPSGEDIKAARQAAGLPLRAWARQIKGGPSHKFWNQIENGIKGEKHLRKLSPDVMEKLVALVAEYKGKRGK